MSNWITSDDYKTKVTDQRLNMIIEDDTTILDAAESTAIANVQDALHTKYDIDVIFASVGDDRPKQVLRWCVNLAVYYIYERIPDKLIPDRVIRNYENTLEVLDKIADGKYSVNLPHLQDEEGYPTSKFRWGSNSPREHR
jgi:phage gp36-like protein